MKERIPHIGMGELQMAAYVRALSGSFEMDYDPADFSRVPLLLRTFINQLVRAGLNDDRQIAEEALYQTLNYLRTPTLPSPQLAPV